MTVRLTSVLLWCACAAACGNTQSLQATEGAMNVIDEEVVTETLENDGLVCVVRVTRVEVNLAGTRSARFRAAADVLRPLHGECGAALEIAGYARDDQAPVEQGGTYVVAVTPSNRVAPALWLEGRAAVSGADVDAAAQAHLALIRRLQGS